MHDIYGNGVVIPITVRTIVKRARDLFECDFVWLPGGLLRVYDEWYRGAIALDNARICVDKLDRVPVL
jgi:hypothetical protein